MKSFLRKIDGYGTKFHFFTFNELKFQTCIGGILTIIIYLITILLIYIFGKNFFHRKNPLFTFSTIAENFEIISLTKEKVSISFRLEDRNGFLFNMTNYFYPVITYYAYETEKEKYSYEEKLNFRKCINKDFENDDDNNLLKKYGELFCIDLEDTKFGGSWNNDFLYFFDISLYYCKDGQNYYENNTNCTSLNYLNNLFLNEEIYMTIYYSTINFRVNNIKEPFSKNYDIYYCVIDNKLRKSDKIYIRKSILNDDKGWLFNDNHNYSVWGVDSILTDYQYYTNEEINQNGFSSHIYTANFYMSFQKNYYTRTYAKLQEIIAILSGLLTFFNFIGKTIYASFNLSLKKIKIINSFLDLNFTNYNKNIDLSNNIFNKNNSAHHFINNNYNNTNINHTNINMINSLKNSFENVLNNNNIYLHLNDNYFNSNKRNKYPDIPYKNIKIPNNISLNTNFEMKISSFVKIDLVSKTICCHNCFYNNKKKKNLIKKHIYNLTNDIYMEKCDILHYFNNLKIVRFLSKILLNDNQILSLKVIKKLNINDCPKFDINESEKIIEYFKNLYKNKINSKLDDFIFENFEDNFKYKIIRKYSE